MGKIKSSKQMRQTLTRFVSRYFYVLLGVVAILIVHIGFSRTYITPVFNGTFTGRKSLHVHGAIFMGWIVLSAVQPLLIQRKQFQWHRRIGVFGFALAAVVTLFGLYIGISTIHKIGRASCRERV